MKHILLQLIAKYLKEINSRKPLLVIYKPEQNTLLPYIEIVTKNKLFAFQK